MGRQAGQETAQHPALRVEDGVFDGRTGPRRHPGRIAHDQGGPPLGKQVGLHHLDPPAMTQAFQVFPGAGQGPGVLVGGDDTGQATLGQERRQDAAAGTDIEGQLPRGQGRLGHQITRLGSLSVN